jgi:hypothetical protein
MVNSYKNLLSKINVLKNAAKILKIVEEGGRYFDMEQDEGNTMYQLTQL